MQRAITRLADEVFDLLIIGGGATGVSIARDGALRGLKVALIEKKDFTSATSAFNSKLIHGGLRYLKNLELGLVRESLRERRIWQRIAPHLVHPLPFLVPLIHSSLAERAMLHAGMTLYDILSYDRGWLNDPYQKLPGHSWLNRREAIAREPVLDTKGFSGAFVYYDAQMYSPERLALECLIDADLHGAAIANYVEAESALRRGDKVEGCTVNDRVSGARFDIRAKITLVATGPWADLFLAQALSQPASRKLLRSKGIHVLVPAVTRKYALTVAADDTHFFVLPWRGHTLLGTTDTAFTGNPDAVGVSEPDIATFFAFMNRYLPTADLKREAVEHFYAGLRPLIDDGSGNTYGASRKAEIVDHAKEGTGGLVSVIGGKWTTSRDLAKQAVGLVVGKTGVRAGACITATASTPGGGIPYFEAFEQSQKTKFPAVTGIAHLARLYGTRLKDVIGLANGKPELLAPLGSTGDIAAQVVHAVREEMAQTLEDVVMRRTGIGQMGRPDSIMLETAARLMGEELGWNDARRNSEIAGLQPVFVTRPDDQ